MPAVVEVRSLVFLSDRVNIIQPVPHSNLHSEKLLLMNNLITFQKVIEYVEALPLDDQDLLIELIKNRRIEKRRAEIAENAAQTLAAVKSGTAKRGTLAELKADLLDSE